MNDLLNDLEKIFTEDDLKKGLENLEKVLVRILRKILHPYF